MAKIEPLRPAPSAPSPARSPERAALAGAIERHRAALDKLNRARAAGPRALDARIAAARRADEAEAALADARAAEPRRLADQLLGEAPAAPGLSVAAAEAALATARGEYAAARAASEQIADAEAAATTELGLAKIHLSEALAAVVAPSAAVAALVAQFDEARGRVDAIAKALGFLGGKGLLPDAARNWDVINRPLPATAPVAPLWRDAIAALEADADASLPGEAPPAGPVAA